MKKHHFKIELAGPGWEPLSRALKHVVAAGAVVLCLSGGSIPSSEAPLPVIAPPSSIISP